MGGGARDGQEPQDRQTETGGRCAPAQDERYPQSTSRKENQVETI